MNKDDVIRLIPEGKKFSISDVLGLVDAHNKYEIVFNKMMVFYIGKRRQVFFKSGAVKWVFFASDHPEYMQLVKMEKSLLYKCRKYRRRLGLFVHSGSKGCFSYRNDIKGINQVRLFFGMRKLKQERV